jgi:hypothetical protein
MLVQARFKTGVVLAIDPSGRCTVDARRSLAREFVWLSPHPEGKRLVIDPSDAVPDALLLFDGRGVLSGRSAAALFGADVLARRAPVEVTVPVGERLASAPGIVVARSVLEPGDVQRWAGMRTTTPLRTTFDIARRPPLFEAVVGVDAMLAARLVTRSQLERFGAARETVAGTRQLRKVLVVCDGGAESPMESRLRAAAPRRTIRPGPAPRRPGRPQNRFPILDSARLCTSRYVVASISS